MVSGGTAQHVELKAITYHCGGGTFAHTATSGLVAVRRGGQETDLSFTTVTAVLPAPQ